MQFCHELTKLNKSYSNAKIITCHSAQLHDDMSFQNHTIFIFTLDQLLDYTDDKLVQHRGAIISLCIELSLMAGQSCSSQLISRSEHRKQNKRTFAIIIEVFMH